MTEIPSTIPAISKHVPWNKGKIVGAKPPLRPKHVWSIRTHPAAAALSGTLKFVKRVTLSLALRLSGDAGRGFGRAGASSALVAG